MHSLSPYVIRVYDNSLPGPRDGRYHTLNKIRKIDLLSVFEKYIDNNSGKLTKLNDETINATIKFSNVKKDKRTIYGHIEYGEYGSKGKVVDVDSGQTVYRKKINDSDIISYYFNIYLPEGETKGIILFHNINGKGIKTLVEKLFNDFFKTITINLKARIKPFAYEKAVQEWLKNAMIKEIRCTNYTPKLNKSDVIDRLGETAIEVTIKPKKKGGALGSLFDLSKRKNHTGANRQAVDILQNDCSSVKAVVEFEGKKRVFSLAANHTPTSSIEFDESEVEFDQGVPKLESLHTFAESLMIDLSTDIF